MHPSKRVSTHVPFLRWWHVHAVVLLAFLAGAVLALSGAWAAKHFARGGYRAGPLPPQIRLSGAALPPSWSLVPDLARLHAQGTSASCVGQTLSTLIEVANNEFAKAHPTYARTHKYFARNTAFSAGFIWNQVNGGQDVGVSYQAAFGVLDSQGDAPLAVFGADGSTSNYWVQPGPKARAWASQHRTSSWRSIASWDRTTIESEIHAGRPIALAINVYASLVNDYWNAPSLPVIAGQSGAFEFPHSILIVGYTPEGVIIQNSWAQWGYQERALFTWGFVQQYATALVGATPAYPYVPPPPKPKKHKPPYPIARWNRYRANHHQRLIPARVGKQLRPAFTHWRYGAKRNGSVVRDSWHPKPHNGGFMVWTFVNKTLYLWKHHLRWQKWTSHGVIR